MALVQLDTGDIPVKVPRQKKEMISVGVESGKTLVRINSSSLGVIQECGRKSQYLLNEGWKSDNESPATLFGSAIHAALEVFYSAPPEGRVMVTLEELERAALSSESLGGEADLNLLYRSVLAFAKKAQPLVQIPDHDKRSILNGAWILYNYFKAYIDDPYVTYVDKDGPFVERKFTYRLYEDASLIIDIFGTIDIAFRNIQTGHILAGDHKTTSSLGYGDQSYYDREKPNHQYTMYVLGAQKVFGIESEDFLVNVIEVKARPKTARGSVPNFPRQLTKRTEDDFAELQDVIVRSVQNYLYMRSTAVWPLGPLSACGSYGACTYRQVCAAPKSLRENVLKSKFIKEI